MAKTNPDTILLRGEVNRIQRDANGVITPGELLTILSTGKVDQHAVSGGPGLRYFAVENDIGGDDLTHDYANGEAVQINSCRPGDRVYAWLASGENVVIGDLLMSAGTGKLAKRTGTNIVIGVALEAINLSATGAAASRIQIEIV